MLWIACLLWGCKSAPPTSVEKGQPYIAAYRASNVSGRNVPELAHAEGLLAAGMEHARQDSPIAVDEFFQAAVECWPGVAASPAGDRRGTRAWQVYHAAVEGVIAAGQRLGRLTPSGKLLVNTPAGPTSVPITYAGFVWKPRDFTELRVARDYPAGGLKQIYRREGIGVPLVVIRRRDFEERFHAKLQRFAATAILRPMTPDGPGAAATAGGGSFALEFYDPLRRASIDIAGQSVPLAGDASAPLATGIADEPNASWVGFLQPGASQTKARLILLEPYQAGKIPVVFVHGLLSDPMAWDDFANELRVRPAIQGRYQMWAFQYPTGKPFLTSAASLREELSLAIAVHDPQQRDPALSQMVLVGHSMGGLLVKLQVVDSGTALWDVTARRPLESLVAPPQAKQRLHDAFFFNAQPYARRVVFLGTPHGGSSLASRFVGRLGAALVEPDGENQRLYRQLIRANRGAFYPFAGQSLPTSIDFLQPDNPVLQALRKLRPRPDVAMHSIIGTGQPMLLEGPADGVVSVSSARLEGVQSERRINAKHSDLHEDPEAVEELCAILTEHLRHSPPPRIEMKIDGPR